MHLPVRDYLFRHVDHKSGFLVFVNVNYFDTVDGAHIVGMITRDSILRVMQARTEVGSLTPTR